MAACQRVTGSVGHELHGPAVAPVAPLAVGRHPEVAAEPLVQVGVVVPLRRGPRRRSPAAPARPRGAAAPARWAASAASQSSRYRRHGQVVGVGGSATHALVVGQRLVEGERPLGLPGGGVGGQPASGAVAGGQPVVGDPAGEAVPCRRRGTVRRSGPRRAARCSRARSPGQQRRRHGLVQQRVAEDVAAAVGHQDVPLDRGPQGVVQGLVRRGRPPGPAARARPGVPPLRPPGRPVGSRRAARRGGPAAGRGP